MTAPSVSPVRWNPNALPIASGGTEAAMSASRGAERTPLPKRSSTRPTSTTGHTPAAATTAFPAAASPYPAPMNGLRPRRSDHLPAKYLVTPAVASATPSMMPNTTGGAAITPMSNAGNNGNNSSLAASCISDTRVRMTRFRVSHTRRSIRRSTDEGASVTRSGSHKPMVRESSTPWATGCHIGERKSCGRARCRGAVLGPYDAAPAAPP